MILLIGTIGIMMKFWQLREGFIRCSLSDDERNVPIGGAYLGHFFPMAETEILTFSLSKPMLLCAIFLTDVVAIYGTNDDEPFLGTLIINETLGDKVLFEKKFDEKIMGLFGSPACYVELPNPIQINANHKYSITIRSTLVWEVRLRIRKLNPIIATNGIHLQIDGKDKFTVIHFLDLKEIPK